jgi:hypothetical protein
VPKTATIGFVYLLKLAANGIIGQAVEEKSEWNYWPSGGGKIRMELLAKRWKKNQKKVKKQATE